MELIKLLKENTERFSTDNINRMLTILTTKNLAFESRLRIYLKKYDNRVSLDFLDSLAILSFALVKKEVPVSIPEPVIWYGYYAEESSKVMVPNANNNE